MSTKDHSSSCAKPAELRLFFRLGVDGLFAGNADTAVAVRDERLGT